MLAEIHGKLSHESTLAAERLEDTLTDAVFGALRYLPRKVLGAVLNAAFGTAFSPSQLDAAVLRFWPRFLGGTEPDVVVEVGGVMIIVEAKYESPFSPGQLVREWRDGRHDALARRLQGPWLLAVTGHSTQPIEIGDAREDLADELAGANLVGSSAVRWVPWRRIAGVVDEQRAGLTPNECDLLTDLLRLMEKRGVRHMFEGFAMEDYWLVTSAQRAAAERLYPKMSHLVQELTGLVAADDLVYANTSPNAIAHWQSLQFAYPGAWTRSYFLAPYWSTSWAQSPPKDLRAALFVIFNFWSPQIEIGFYLQPASPADRPAWLATADDIASTFQSLPKPLQVVTDSGGWTRTAETRAPSDVDEPWIKGVVSRGGHLRFHKSLAAEEVRSASQLRDALVDIRDSVTERPLLLQLIGSPSASSAPGNDSPMA